jgi:hypothetical protein
MNALSNVVFSVGGQDPIVDSFASSDAAPQPGTPYTLSWQARSASSVTISGIGNVALSGSTARVAGELNSGSIYQLTVVGLNGRSISTSLSVSATNPPIPQCECTRTIWSNNTKCGGGDGDNWINGKSALGQCSIPGIKL